MISSYIITYTPTPTARFLPVRHLFPADEKSCDQIGSSSRKKQFSIDVMCTEVISNKANTDFYQFKYNRPAGASIVQQRGLALTPAPELQRDLASLWNLWRNVARGARCSCSAKLLLWFIDSMRKLIGLIDGIDP